MATSDQDDLARYFREGIDALTQGRATLHSWGPAVGDQAWPGSSISYPAEPGRTFTDAKLTVTKVTGWLPVSDEVAMDAGAIPDTRPAPSRWRRARWKAAAWRERAARRAYRMIAGQWPHEPDPYE